MWRTIWKKIVIHKFEVQHSWLCGQLFYDSILRIGNYWLRKKKFKKNLFKKVKENDNFHCIAFIFVIFDIFYSSFIYWAEFLKICSFSHTLISSPSIHLHQGAIAFDHSEHRKKLIPNFCEVLTSIWAHEKLSLRLNPFHL